VSKVKKCLENIHEYFEKKGPLKALCGNEVGGGRGRGEGKLDGKDRETWEIIVFQEKKKKQESIAEHGET